MEKKKTRNTLATEKNWKKIRTMKGKQRNFEYPKGL